jgi:hypothetical protein
VDNQIYNGIEEVLYTKNPNSTELNDCIMKNLKNEKVADKFHTFRIFINQEKIAKEIKAKIDEANTDCFTEMFIKTTVDLIGDLISIYAQNRLEKKGKEQPLDPFSPSSNNQTSSYA